MTNNRQHYLVIGLGKTGLSCVRWLRSQGHQVTVADSRAAPPMLDELQADWPEVECVLGEFDEALLDGIQAVALSPGVSDDLPLIQAARVRGLPVLGDIEIFAREIADTDVKLIAVTGSNGKSTVVSLLGEMAQRAGCKAVVAGNIGLPVLDALVAAHEQGMPELFILELSSFQLETTESLNADAACVLNISADHMDRYCGLDEYIQAKARIYKGAKRAVINADDSLAAGLVAEDIAEVAFSLSHLEQGFGVVRSSGESWLAKNGEPLLPVNAMQLSGAHNQANALAALALGDAVGLGMDGMLAGLQQFNGLAHRMQWIGDWQGSAWFNDSKGTNVGATVAALQGMPLKAEQKVILIAGGDGKGQDFTPLRAALADRARAVVLIGKDASNIARAIKATVRTRRADSMQAAVQAAANLQHAGDVVLLSPACASFDMFDNYIARGEAFVTAFQTLGGERQEAVA